MKWNKKGHEFDDIYLAMKQKSKFYLFGAGDYGGQFFNIMKSEINIEGFIDNVREGSFCEKKIFKLKDIKKEPQIAIIITASQIARMSIVEEMKNNDYKKNVDYFLLEEFLGIWFVYTYNKVYFSSISFLPSSACNLNCRHCLNFNPFSKTKYVRNLDEIKDDLDLFFEKVDNVMLFHVSGGEPFIYKNLIDVLEYLDLRYGERIGTLRTVTNGTIIPNDTLMQRLSRLNVEVTIDDYRKNVQQCRDNFDNIVRKFNNYNIKYVINRTDSWLDLAPEKTDYSYLTDEMLQKHFDECCQSWQDLRDGKIHLCNYDSYAGVAELNNGQESDYYDLHWCNSDNKKELVEFRLGYSERGYASFCKKCRGFSNMNSLIVEPAIQCGKGEKEKIMGIRYYETQARRKIEDE